MYITGFSMKIIIIITGLIMIKCFNRLTALIRIVFELQRIQVSFTFISHAVKWSHWSAERC